MRSYDHSIAGVRRLARLLASEDGQRTFLELQRIGRAGNFQSKSSSIWPTGEEVGIYIRDGAGWRRDQARRHEWRLWADVDSIPPKSEQRRIVLLGESVARGYFFDPVLTPAAQIARSLPEYEVIDLARTDADAADIATLALECHALAPDLILLVAGNNWTQTSLDEVSAERWATAIREESPEAIRAAADVSLAEKAEVVIGVLTLVARTTNCRVIVVVPESNTIDWREHPRRFIPYLRGERFLAWWGEQDHARAALDHGAFTQAIEHARRMEHLDGGLSDLAPRLQAEALLAQGAEELAIVALGKARDALLGRFDPVAPRVGRVVQDLLKIAAQEVGFECVDLTELFDVPDRRVFLDYCHLSLEGLNAATRAVSRQIDPNAPILEAAISASDHATALMLAALHNAHHGQSVDVVRYHLNRARALNPSIDVACKAWLACRAHIRPAWMGAPFSKLYASPLTRRYLDAFDPVGAEQVSEFQLASALGEKSLAEYVLALANALDASVDLLNPTLFAKSLADSRGLSINATRAYHCAHGPTSTFLLPLSRPLDLYLQAVIRLPPGRPVTGKVGLRVNGYPLTSWVVGERWQQVATNVSSSVLRPGLQRIELIWPTRKPAADTALEEAARAVERLTAPELFPIYGAIDRLRATHQGSRVRPHS